ncbi:LysR family transcriptional regulator [Pseudonocardia xinjiangensis]|uniref:LysR family transcriptional regulator n=1 Tax=Pseudonocardia xinjiangensis TaxID=75289 RepID=A0ABX1RKH0_9PSEU|nr:LysR family transcriptional regulator [Pseudonocardia xinjiangensis]NMH80848.1 LysR family transcriptional regulator [Pseudonocardia xinjiangensis]
MELRHLTAFVAVADEGGFTRAADRLHLVQSAVSAAVRNLEKDLGAVLFERSSRGVTLTGAGRALLPEARATLAAATAARESVEQVAGGLRGTVTLGVMQAMRTISVPGVLSVFRTEHPNVTVEVRHAGGSPGNAEQVRDGRLDLAFVSLPDERMPGLAVTPLTREPMLLAVSPEHPLSGRRSVELAALSGEVFVDFPAGWGMREANDRAFAAAAVQRTVAYDINDAATVLDFVGHGLAAGMITASAVEGRRDIVLVPVRHHVPHFETAVAVAAGRRLGAAADALLATICRAAGVGDPGGCLRR